MSRTTKDTPYWTRATWYEPQHRCREHAVRNWLWPHDTCDLPRDPVRRSGKPFHGQSNCEWEPIWSWEERRRCGVPTWFIHHIWTNHQRTLMRTQLTRARQEWNGSGDTDVDVANHQHRHRAAWLYW